MKRNRYRRLSGYPVKVRWLDSTRVLNGWAPASDYLGRTSAPTRAVTVGLMVPSPADRIIVALSWSDRGHWCDAMSIPMSAVRSVRRLK